MAQTARPDLVYELNPWPGTKKMGKIRNSVSTRWRQVHAPKNKCRVSRTWKVIRAGVEQSVKRLLKVQIAQKAGRTFVILNRKRSDWSWILFGEGERKARFRFWRTSLFTSWRQSVAKAYQDRDNDDEYLTICVRESHDPDHAFGTLAHPNIFSFENTEENWAWLVRSARKSVRIKDAMRVAISVNRISVTS